MAFLAGIFLDAKTSNDITFFVAIGVYAKPASPTFGVERSDLDGDHTIACRQGLKHPFATTAV